jgi:hypothetical protein
VPWWSKNTKVCYIDTVNPVRYDGESKMSLFGFGQLERYSSTLYNGQQVSSGDFSEKALFRLRDAVNEYREAFFRHDSDEAKEFRKRYRETLEEKLSSARQGERNDSRMDRKRKQDKQRERMAKRVEDRASAEEKRRKKIDDKFAQ